MLRRRDFHNPADRAKPVADYAPVGCRFRGHLGAVATNIVQLTAAELNPRVN